ncbi:MAG TPA: tetratricopeptide repeat protein [Luteibaculaceae bacterium]|nr:tetratricopeptide repeat protein [Luteibaculaceae bacterium]
MRTLLLLLTVFLVFGSAQGQKTMYFTPLPTLQRQAADLFEKEKFAAAQKKYDQIIAAIPNPNDEVRVNAEYFRALCALKLFNKDAVQLLEGFVAQHSDSKWIEPAYFQLGNYHYRKKKYDEVIRYFSKVSEFRLTAEERIEYKFKLGYSYMKEGDPVKAMANLNDVANAESEYFAPANYYLAHLHYLQGNYQSALQGFEKIKDEKGFSDIIPYYVAHIYFLQKKYQAVIDYATDLVDQVSDDQRVQINKLLGESHFNLGNFQEALPYLEAYSVGSPSKALADYYQLGYCYYKTGDAVKAILQFGPVAVENTKMGQAAQYHLGDCYLKTGNKSAARNAFLAASKLDFDPIIAEDALFNYAKLAYELSYNPYHEAITAFKEYLEKYPDTERSDEANEFLFFVFLNTKNYQAGIDALNLIKNKDSRMQQAYQYIAYNRGVELMLAKRGEEAFDYLEKSKVYPIDKKMVALATYWQADLRYAEAKYKTAAGLYQTFQRLPGSYASGYYDESFYHLGYCQFKTGSYTEAASNFRKFIGKPGTSDPKQYNDAILRVGDCYFVSKQFDLAVDFYEKAYKQGLVDADYGLYQAALGRGYIGRENEKINTLQTLIREYPESPFVVDATYELGDAYFKSNQDEKALTTLQKLQKDFAGSNYARKGSLLSGLILYRQKRYDDAITVFKKIASDYPNYDDAKEAIARAEDIYVELGRIEEYNDWVQNLSFYNVSTTALDSVNYRSASNLFVAGEFERARNSFKNYLQKFPKGNFVVSANYYLAECYYKEKDLTQALEYYTAVINAPTNTFTENALVAAAYINYGNKNYSAAIDNYAKLEKVAEYKTNILDAKIGQMRCYYKMENTADAMASADRVLSESNLPAKIKVEAQMIKARTLLKLGELEKSRVLFEEVASSTKTVEGAEARYNLAYLLFTQKELKKCEDAIFEMINAKPAYDHWIAKGFVLLADVYYQQNDIFQAKATLQSVIDNHNGPDMVEVARQKLAQILEAEKKPETVNPTPAEIKTGEDGQYEKLFKEEAEKPKTEKKNTNDQPNNPQ